jgi:hypothetical protein
MKAVIILCILVSQASVIGYPRISPKDQSVSQTAAGKGERSRVWRAARYRGLTMGKSKVADMLRVLGKPQRSEIFNDATADAEIWYHYDGVWEFSGRLTFHVHKATHMIEFVELVPEALKKEDVIKYFGADYIITRYDFDSCLGDEESAPIFESPRGSIISIEYRQRGIAISVNERGDVNAISYVSKPLGPAESKCNPSKNG